MNKKLNKKSKKLGDLIKDSKCISPLEANMGYSRFWTAFLSQIFRMKTNPQNNENL